MTKEENNPDVHRHRRIYGLPTKQGVFQITKAAVLTGTTWLTGSEYVHREVPDVPESPCSPWQLCHCLLYGCSLARALTTSWLQTFAITTDAML